MFAHRILDSNMNEVSKINWGELEYPDYNEEKIFFQNQGQNPVNATIAVRRGLSVHNFTPNCITDAYILDYGSILNFLYAEIVFVANRVCSDLANFPEIEKEIQVDGDGYCSNVIPNINIKFYDTREGSSARILISEFNAMGGVALDEDGSPGGYKELITLNEVQPGETIPFWYKFILRDKMEGERNPRIFNLVAKGSEIIV